MKKRYFYLKIGEGNQLVDECLQGKSIYSKKPCGVIFYGKSKIDELFKETGNSLKDLKQGQITQAKDFCESSLKENRKYSYFITTCKGFLWITQPNSEVYQYVESGNSIAKVINLKILKHVKLSKIPLILASINSNRYYCSGTFRQIMKRGNIKAIRSVLGWELLSKHYEEKYLKSKYILECLSSIELETLVAKIFEAYGCFVPAYRGGYMKDIDIFAKNKGEERVNIGRVEIDAGKSISIQIKLKYSEREEIFSDYLISLNGRNKRKHLNADWILDQVKNNPNLEDWFRSSLNWLPEEYITKFFD